MNAGSGMLARRPKIAPDAYTPAQSGLRSRRLLLLERTMYRDGRTPFTSVFTVKLLGNLYETRLRQALTQLQAKHPLLRCVIEDAADGPRFVLQNRAAPIPLRIVERRNEDDWKALALQEWVTPFDASREPLVRLAWLRGGAINELMLVGHHCVCDGPTGITLLRECLSAYDFPEQELGAYDTLGALEDIVPAEMMQNRSFRLRARTKAGLLRITLMLKPRHRGSACSVIAREQMYFHCWQLDRSAALALAERCKSEGVTVFSAISVAALQAFRDVRGASALNRAYAMVNARRFMPQLRPDAMFGLAPGVALRIKDLPPPQHMSPSGFWTSARAVRTDLTRRISRLGAGLYGYLVCFESLHDKYARLVADTEGALAVRHVTLSNMGRIDLPQQYPSFRLDAVYSPLVMVSPTPANTVIFSSFAGQMEFSIVSDELSLPQAQALAIKQRIMEILRICAAIPQLAELSRANEILAKQAITI